jgi:hypothetical protein
MSRARECVAVVAVDVVLSVVSRQQHPRPTNHLLSLCHFLSPSRRRRTNPPSLAATICELDEQLGGDRGLAHGWIGGKRPRLHDNFDLVVGVRGLQRDLQVGGGGRQEVRLGRVRGDVHTGAHP